ncbi:MAG TPA: hypothetical protein VFW86_04865 [Candidatus Limnocylindrales bacterium]|nr:hypothetical protein [Candidatus Limnocylindrales bacterium]
MDPQALAVPLLLAALAGILAVAAIIQRRDRGARLAPSEGRFAASSEGETRCPSCGLGNLVSDASCVACGARLPSHHAPNEG